MRTCVIYDYFHVMKLIKFIMVCWSILYISIFFVRYHSAPNTSQCLPNTIFKTISENRVQMMITYVDRFKRFGCQCSDNSLARPDFVVLYTKTHRWKISILMEINYWTNETEKLSGHFFLKRPSPLIVAYFVFGAYFQKPLSKVCSQLMIFVVHCVFCRLIYL